MVPTDNSSPHTTRTEKQYVVSYTQSDVDMIREQMEQTEAAKRRWLVLTLFVTAALLVGSLVLVSTSYALYSSSDADRERLNQENTALKASAEQCRQQVDSLTAKEARENQARAEAQARLERLKSSVLGSNMAGGDVASFARMVYELPNRSIELDSKPSDKIFRNWKTSAGSATEIYTLVGGFVDGKWVVHSNLIARK